MVCKEDVVSWFKELESYKRIDAMCNLLNMCLPFELRFIGTYLEELGKRDFQELRGAELRANSNTDLATDIGGATTDHRTRRKMALYVSLLRSCNYACATTLYNVMVGLEQSGLLSGVYGDPLEELLLLYTMALHHPAFTFDQHTHFGEILEKLKIENQRNRYNQPITSTNTTPSSNSCIMNTNLSVPPPDVPGLTTINVYVKTTLQGQAVSSEQINEVVNQSVGLSNAPIHTTNEQMFPIITAEPSSVGIPVPYPMGEFVLGQPHWPTGFIMPSINPAVEMLSCPPPSASPIISQTSSPCESRAGSPRAVAPTPIPTPHMPPPALPRPPRRPSQDSTPPPPSQHQQLQIMEHPHLQIVPHFGNMALNEGGLSNSEPVEYSETSRYFEKRDIAALGDHRHTIDEKSDDPEALQMKNMRLRHILEKNNGIRRVSGRRGASYSTPQSRSTLQHQSSGSDSGSSTGSHSPPRPAQFSQHRPYPNFPFTPPAYPHFPPANGEAPMYPQYAFGPQVYTPKSCWNCGASGHSGGECKEPSIDDMTRAAVYHLDYSTAPPDINDK